MEAKDYGLTGARAEAVRALADRLCEVDGVAAVVLGGSRAVGAHHEGSDVDLGVYYEGEETLDLGGLRTLASEVNDLPAPVVTGPWEWGCWVNGGAWLRIDGLRVDWIYRRLSHVEETLRALGRGEVQVDWMQQPPFGFASLLYGGETFHCVALHDEAGHVAKLKQLVAPYPEELRRSIAQNWTWAADLALRKGAAYASKGDVANVVGCLSRAFWFLAHVVHALDRRWAFPESRLFRNTRDLESAPYDFATRVDGTLRALGADTGELERTISHSRRLLDEVARSAGELYRAPPFPE